MKLRPLFFVPLLPLLALDASAQATLTWDANTGTTAAQDGAGIWDTSNTNWWNGSANQSFVANDNVIFGVAGANTAHTVTLATTTSTGSLTFANTNSFPRYTLDLGVNTLTVNGLLSLNAQANNYYTAFSNGTLALRRTGSSEAAPDIFFDPNDGGDYGVVIGSTLDVGTGSRYIRGAPQRNSVARYSGDLRFNGSLTGSAGLFFSGTTVDSNHLMHYVLNANNSGFTGAVTLNANTDLSLTNSAALSSANNVAFSAGAGRAALFLFGQNVTIGNLSDSGTGTRWIRNGARNTTNAGTNTTNGGLVALGVNADSVLTITQSAAGSFGGVISDGPNDDGLGTTATDYRKLGITKAGSATLTLTGTNTYTGGTTVNAGGLSISNGSALGTGAVNYTAVGTSLTITGTAVTLANNIALPTSGTGNVSLVTPNNSSTVLNGVLSGGAAGTVLYYQGGATGQNTGILTLNGDNTGLLGTINIQRGPIILGNANAAGSTKIIIDSNNHPSGALQLGNFSIANNLELVSGASIGVGTGNAATVTGTISSTAATALLKVGAGSLTLTNANSYTGATNVNAGSLILGNASALGTTAAGTTVAAGAVLDLNGQNIGAEAVTINGTGISAGGVLLNTSVTGATLGANLTLASASTINTTGDILVSGNVDGVFPLTKTGAGTLTLGGTIAASLVSVDEGVLALSSTLSLASGQTLVAGRASTPATDISGTIATGAGTLNIRSGTATGSLSISGDLNMNGGTVNMDLSNIAASGNDILLVGGTLDLSAPTTLAINRVNVELGNGTYVLAQASAVTGDIANVTFAGLPTSGSTRQSFTPTVTGTELQLVVAGNPSNLVWNNAELTNTWSQDEFNENWDNLTLVDAQDRFFAFDSVTFPELAESTQIVTLGTDVEPAAISFTNSSTAYTLTGANITGSTGLSVNGTGTVTIDGSSHGYTGTTTINAGKLSIAGIANAGLPSSIGAGDNTAGKLVLGGGILEYTGATASTDRGFTLTDATTSTIDVTNGAADLSISGPGATTTGALIKSGAGTLTLGGAHGYSGGTTLANGSLVAALGTTAGARSSFGSGPITATTGTSLGFIAGVTANTMTHANALSLDGATLVVTEANQTFSGGITLAGSNTFQIDTSGRTATFSGTVTGSGTITKTQAGALVFSADNPSFGGGITVDGGTLTASLGLTAGTRTVLGTGAITANNGTTLRFFAGSTANAMSHANAINLDGATLTSEDAVQTYTGAITLTGANNVNVVYGGKDAVFSGGVSGTGSLAKSGAGTLTLTDTNNYGGGTSLSAGQLRLATTDAVGSGDVTITGGQMHFTVPSGSTSTLANNISLPAVGSPQLNILAPTSSTTVRLTGKLSGGTAGQVYRIGDSQVGGNHNGTLILDNANNDFSGTIEIYRGTLAITSDAALGNADNDIIHYTENLNGSLRFDADNITLAPTRAIQLVANDDPINTQAFTATISGPISGAGRFVKQGSGKLILSGTNSATGTSTVAEGTLQVDGTFATATGTVTVASGATLAGTGTINRPVTITGTLNPGAANTADTLDVVGATTINGGYTCDLDGANKDVVAVTGNLTLGAASSLTVNTLSPGATFPIVIATYSGSLTGTFASVTAGYEVDYASSPGQILLKETSGYADWASVNAPTGNANDDFDTDGVPNGVEYVLGGDKDTNDLDKLPVSTTDGTNMTFTFKRSQASKTPDTAVAIEVGTDLLAWPDVYTVGADTAGSTPPVTVTDNSPETTDTITLTVPMTPDTEKFARLRVVVTP